MLCAIWEEKSRRHYQSDRLHLRGVLMKKIPRQAVKLWAVLRSVRFTHHAFSASAFIAATSSRLIASNSHPSVEIPRFLKNQPISDSAMGAIPAMTGVRLALS
jgi:hypothetical protein